MKYSYKLSDAIHLLSYLEIFKDKDRSSRTIANSIEANPSVIRQLMTDLKKAGFIETKKGKANTVLIKSPKTISILDIYQAINIDHNLLHIDPKTNPNCFVGSHIQDTLNTFYSKIENAAFNEMDQISLDDVINNLLKN